MKTMFEITMGVLLALLIVLGVAGPALQASNGTDAAASHILQSGGRSRPAFRRHGGFVVPCGMEIRGRYLRPKKKKAYRYWSHRKVGSAAKKGEVRAATKLRLRVEAEAARLLRRRRTAAVQRSKVQLSGKPNWLKDSENKALARAIAAGAAPRRPDGSHWGSHRRPLAQAMGWRQILNTDDLVGVAKVQSAKATLNALNADVKVVTPGRTGISMETPKSRRSGKTPAELALVRAQLAPKNNKNMAGRKPRGPKEVAAMRQRMARICPFEGPISVDVPPQWRDVAEAHRNRCVAQWWAAQFEAQEAA